MESDDKIPWSFQSWASFAMFLLLTWGIVIFPPSLVSKRPAGEPGSPPSKPQEHRYESRLWQDPFELLAAQSREDPGVECTTLAKSKRVQSSAAVNPNTLILAVFLRGEGYPEDVENRIRSRYAVVSALSAAGYTPDLGGDLLCLSVSGLERGDFPFEWFTHQGQCSVADKNPYQENLEHLVASELNKRNLPESVAVVWVDERLFDGTYVGSHPLENLRTLAKQLPNDLTDARLAMLGPTSSDTLRALLSDNKNVTDEQPGDSEKVRTPIYSFASTDEALRKKTPDRSSLVEKCFRLVHVIGTDYQLADALREELERRGVDPAKIALVAEWDTSYGRNMIEVFSHKFEEYPTTRCASAEPDPAAKVRCFTYLRGIDGRLPKSPAAESKEADKVGGQAKGVFFPGGEALMAPPQVQAFGPSQVDYIPRLVAQMKAQAGTREWKAIGVLGSDFYDKIMLIEVLRHDFPEALIFTTDMDARYLDTDKHHITRNLLVGSHYGLELNKSLQGAIPSFRSVYQTSLFFGCLKALYVESTLAEGGKESWPNSPLMTNWNSPNCKDSLKPLVFEIGRSRAYPLTNPVPENLHPETYRRSLGLTSRQWVSLVILTVLSGALGLVLLPVLTRRHFPFAVAVTGLFLLVLFGLMFVSAFRFDSAGLSQGLLALWVVSMLATIKAQFSQLDWLRNPLVLLAALFIPIVILAIIDHCSGEGMPFSVLEGVSNWPVILIRVTAAAYCVFALIRADQADEESVSRLSNRYHLQKVSSQDNTPAENAGSCRTLVEKRCPALVPPRSTLTGHCDLDRALPLYVRRAVGTLCRAWVWAKMNPVSSLAKDQKKKNNGKNNVDPIRLWVRYRRFSRVDRVIARVLRYPGLLYFAFCFALFGLLGPPPNPYRGPLNMVVNFVVLVTAISLTVGLLLTVFDATCLCNQLMKVLMEEETDWSDQVIREAADNLGVNPQLLHFKVYSDREPVDCEPVKISLEQYADLKFVSERTEVVRRRVYDAAIPILLMSLARSPLFDQYVMSWSIILIFAVAFAVVFACGYCLRRSAREARRKGQEKIAKALEKVRESVYDMRFGSWREPNGDGGMPDFEDPVVELSAFCTEGPAAELVHATRWPHLVAKPPETDRRRTVREDAVHALERIDQGLDQITTGAFSKLKDDPFLHTLIVIVGGYGALQSLEIILRMLL